MVGPSTRRVAARTGARGPAVGPWLGIALALLVATVAVDVITAERLLFTTAFVLAPFALAASGHARATAGIAVVAAVLAVASGVWNEDAGSTHHLLRIAVVAAGGALATLSATALERAAEQRARMAVLAAVSHLGGAQRVEDAVEGLSAGLVPAAADTAWVDLLEPDGKLRRLFEHGAEPAPPPAHAQNAYLDGRHARIPLQDFGVLGLSRAGGLREDDLAFLEILAGRVALVLANARLVTDLRSTRARLDGILGALAEAVTVQDEHGEMVYANAAAARLLGRSSPGEVTLARPGELASRFTITGEDGRPIGLGDLPGQRLLDGEETAPELLTRTIDKATGRAYWLLTKATRLEDQGRTFAVNIIEDVTEAKEAEVRQRFLAQAGQLLASSLDYQETLQRVADLAISWLADWCAVDLPDGDGGIESVALAHKDPDKVARAHELRRRWPPDPEAERGVPAVLRGGPAELFAEVPDALLERMIEDPERLEALRAIGMRSVMVVPMRLGEETLGALTLATADGGRRFTEADLAFAQDLALRAATAVQNARLYKEKARVAHTLQSSLLPERLPILEGWESAASYQAGEQGADVGGDFYDIVPTGDGRHLVFLGDVTGKGIAAAALTSLVRHSVRAAARFDSRPGKVLELVNEILFEQPRLSPVTLVCALLEGPALTLAAGGHPAPLLRRAGATTTEIGAEGVLLGAVSNRTYSQVTLDLEPGDAVLFYTDGVTDTPGREGRFGAERLAGILADAPAEPARVLERVEAALRDFQAGTAIDDRAMLVLRRTTI